MKAMRYITGFIISAAVLLTGCINEDIEEFRNKEKENAARIAALEEWQKTVNSQIASLQGLITALEANDYVTGVTPVMKDGAEVGYTITFIKSAPVTVYHGKKGDKGDKGEPGAYPLIGVKQDPDDGRYYWTLNGEWLKDGEKRFPVSGDKGDPGTPGAAGVTPKVIIGSDGYWYISEDGTALGIPPNDDYHWIPTSIPATGFQGPEGPQGPAGSQGPAGYPIFDQDGISQDDDTVTFTLAWGTGTFTLPKYKTMGISFEQPEEFIPSTSRVIPYTVSGGTNGTTPYSIMISGLPAGWTYSVDYTEQEITITASPRGITEDNYTAEATVIVKSGSHTAMYNLSVNAPLNFTGPGQNKVGGFYYRNGVVIGVVVVPSTKDRAGWIVGLTQAKRDWSFNYRYNAVYANHLLYGSNNMYYIAREIAERLSLRYPSWWVDFPAFEWVDKLNGPSGSTTYVFTANYRPQTDVWFLPSKSELQYLYCAFNGAAPKRWDSGTEGAPPANEAARAEFNAALIAAGGTPLNYGSKEPYLSSTQMEGDYSRSGAWGIWLFDGKTDYINKRDLTLTRAMLAFKEPFN